MFHHVPRDMVKPLSNVVVLEVPANNSGAKCWSIPEPRVSHRAICTNSWKTVPCLSALDFSPPQRHARALWQCLRVSWEPMEYVQNAVDLSEKIANNG